MKSSSLREFIDSPNATAYNGEPLVAGRWRLVLAMMWLK